MRTTIRRIRKGRQMFNSVPRHSYWGLISNNFKACLLPGQNVDTTKSLIFLRRT